MSKHLDSAKIAGFNDDLKLAYEKRTGTLRPCVRVQKDVVGGTYRFPVFGKAAARKRLPQAEVVPANVGNAYQTCTLEDWSADDYTDIFAQAKVNWQEQKGLAAALAAAIVRREDQLIIDAMAASGTTLTVSEDEGGSDSGLNVEKIIAAAERLDTNEVEEGDRYFVAHTKGKAQLLGETKFTSSDYAGVKALVNGDANTFMDFDFKWIGNRSEEGGLSLASNVRQNFAFKGGEIMSAVGLAVARWLDHKTDVNWVPTKKSWLASNDFSAGAIHIDAVGIVEVSSYEP